MNKTIANLRTKVLAVLLIIGMIVSLGSCNKGNDDGSSSASGKKSNSSSKSGSSGDGSSDEDGDDSSGDSEDGDNDDDGDGDATGNSSKGSGSKNSSKGSGSGSGDPTGGYDENGNPNTGVNEDGTISDFLNPVKLKNYKDAEEVIGKLGKTPASGDVDVYEIHKDGGLIFNPISTEAIKNKTIDKYKSAATTSGSIKLGNATLEYQIPKNVTAYDAVPITYKFTGASADQAVHIQANAFEDETKRKGKDLYDLNMPGTVDVKIEYQGYVAAEYDSTKKAVTAYDFNDKQSSEYPPYKNMTALTKSGTVPQAGVTWMKFSYTNTGNTILDPDGNGTFCFEPVLYKKNESGNYVHSQNTVNLFERIFDYVYPGEGGEMWVNFGNAGYTPGDYRIYINGLVRNAQGGEPDWPSTIWGGYQATQDYFDFTVTAQGKQSTPKAVVHSRKDLKRNRWLHTYEEFMSSYDTWISPESGSGSGTMYVQFAPWSNQLVMKMVIGDQQQIKTINVPVNVESSSLKINLNTNNQSYVIKSDGSRYPMITTQLMGDMRSNVQRGPDTASYVINDLRDMQEAGVNSLATTVAFGYDNSTTAGQGTASLDASKFAFDVARKMGFYMEGYSSYPYNETVSIANAINQANGISTVLKGSNTGFGEIAHASANAVLSNYSFKRYGDFYQQLGNGTITITTEDSRGWLRIDLRNRHQLGKNTITDLRTFLSKAYGNITNLNKAYGSSYKNFTAIDPQADTKTLDHYRDYTDLGNTYSDWGKAVTDLDIYRTVERAVGYEKLLSETIVPNAKMKIRTEGSNWMVAGINPKTTNAHYRHSYYSNRRNGLIPEIMQASGTTASHADYITAPYTPSEVAELTKQSVAQGIIPMHLPQFNRMREYAINKKYGDMTLAVDYNFDTLLKGAYIDTCSSLYEWWVATYENGGVPGILWQDYLCDGMTTATQFKEMKFFKQKLDETMNTTEGKNWSKNFKAPDQSWRNQSLKRYSYSESYVQQMIANVPRKNVFN